jgi:hypothetical protein
MLLQDIRSETAVPNIALNINDSTFIIQVILILFLQCDDLLLKLLLNGR